MSEKIKMSEELKQKIQNQIGEKINPDIKKIFLKLFVIHLGVALVTLSFCPQLGVSSFNTGLDLAHKLMSLGKYSCELFCGFLFTSSTIAVSFFFLNRDEIRVLRFNKTFLASVLVLISIGGLLMFNQKLFVELSILWLIGTLFGVVGTLEMGYFLIRRV